MAGRGKKEASIQYEIKAMTVFLASSIALVLTSVLNVITGKSGITGGLTGFLSTVIAVFFVFSYLAAIKGFFILNKAYRLDDDHRSYFLGRNLGIFSIIGLAVSSLAEAFIIFSYVVLARYASKGMLTAAEQNAVVNLHTLDAIVMIVMQIMSVSTAFIVYLAHVRKNKDTPDSVGNFALLTALVLAVQLAIGIISTIYSLRGNTTSFLTQFSGIMLVVKYLLLTLFFILRRDSLIKELAPKPEPEDEASEKEENAD